MIPTYLDAKCGDVCTDYTCAESVKLNEGTGRWFITISHAGFNSEKNNRDGYKTRAAARSAHDFYSFNGVN